jgi:hypothetical protein
MKQYSFNDDEERRWLIWYTKLLHMSGLLSTRGSVVSNTINWLFAYLHRCTTDANWFKDNSSWLKEIAKEETIEDCKDVNVLERVFFANSRLTGCYMVEQCRSRTKSNDNWYWHSRKPCGIGMNPDIIVKRHSIGQ